MNQTRRMFMDRSVDRVRSGSGNSRLAVWLLAVVCVVPAISSLAFGQADIAVSYSDDATEATVGVFQQPNVAPVTPAGFAQLRFLMRPIVLSAAGESGAVTLSQTAGDSILDCFLPSGLRVTLPQVFDASNLPQQLLVAVANLVQGRFAHVEFLLFSQHDGDSSVGDATRRR